MNSKQTNHSISNLEKKWIHLLDSGTMPTAHRLFVADVDTKSQIKHLPASQGHIQFANGNARLHHTLFTVELHLENTVREALLNKRFFLSTGAKFETLASCFLVTIARALENSMHCEVYKWFGSRCNFLYDAFCNCQFSLNSLYSFLIYTIRCKHLLDLQ